MHKNPFQVIEGLVEDRELVFCFFALFSRFEYALKKKGFLRNEKRAKPDWNTFGESLCGRFAGVCDSKFKEACLYLKKHPPRRQVVDMGHIVWEDLKQRGSREAEEPYLLRLVKTVRNNLFHGGKYQSGQEPEVARDRRLLEAGIAVLEECLDLSPGIRSVFEDTE